MMTFGEGLKIFQEGIKNFTFGNEDREKILSTDVERKTVTFHGDSEISFGDEDFSIKEFMLFMEMSKEHDMLKFDQSRDFGIMTLEKQYGGRDVLISVYEWNIPLQCIDCMMLSKLTGLQPVTS